ncbi:VPLPA-CTERM sorting domain-containing protein [uncultured Rhodospira sp.]|uniref:VPLPA-CTERM sorting domain-containing protein n=1 Tax=uncultured Rhodospira sp. TaxID=1936189 RepID=UPI0026042454|nr:VPLPA-CTERM sorting domain-containing protein [uncultured Rhodospira sp.]
MKTMVGLMAGAAMLAGASVANAAMIDLGDASFSGLHGLESGSVILGDGVTLTVTAKSSWDFIPGWGPVEPTIDHTSEGLGVLNNAWEDPQVDGEWSNDSLLFEFSRAVNLINVWFTANNEESCFWFFCSDETNDDWNIYVNDVLVAVDDPQNPFPFGNDGIGAIRFEALADGASDDWRVSQIEYEVPAVPLPAAVWFMLTALGGLAGSRWLKKGAKAAAA